MHLLPTLLLCAALSLTARAFPDAGEDPENEPPAPEKPTVKDLGDGKFEIGLVHFDSKTREVTFPCTVNMTEGLLEFAIVHENGKIHESLLSSKVNARDINIAMKLLRFQPSRELFQILDEDFTGTGTYPDVPEEIRAAARVVLRVAWKDAGGKEHEAGLNDWISNAETKSPVAAVPWVYGGSYFHRGVFQAQAMGDIAAIFTSNAALFNYPGKGRGNDEVWIPTTKRVPPIGTPVTVTIQPPLK